MKILKFETYSGHNKIIHLRELCLADVPGSFLSFLYEDFEEIKPNDRFYQTGSFFDYEDPLEMNWEDWRQLLYRSPIEAVSEGINWQLVESTHYDILNEDIMSGVFKLRQDAAKKIEEEKEEERRKREEEENNYASFKRHLVHLSLGTKLKKVKVSPFPGGDEVTAWAVVKQGKTAPFCLFKLPAESFYRFHHYDTCRGFPGMEKITRRETAVQLILYLSDELDLSGEIENADTVKEFSSRFVTFLEMH